LFCRTGTPSSGFGFAGLQGRRSCLAGRDCSSNAHRMPGWRLCGGEFWARRSYRPWRRARGVVARIRAKLLALRPLQDGVAHSGRHRMAAHSRSPHASTRSRAHPRGPRDPRIGEPPLHRLAGRAAPQEFDLGFRHGAARGRVGGPAGLSCPCASRAIPYGPSHFLLPSPLWASGRGGWCRAMGHPCAATPDPPPRPSPTGGRGKRPTVPTRFPRRRPQSLRPMACGQRLHLNANRRNRRLTAMVRTRDDAGSRHPRLAAAVFRDGAWRARVRRLAARLRSLVTARLLFALCSRAQRCVAAAP